jgi:hypothetical protein
MKEDQKQHLEVKRTKEGIAGLSSFRHLGPASNPDDGLNRIRSSHLGRGTRVEKAAQRPVNVSRVIVTASQSKGL